MRRRSLLRTLAVAAPAAAVTGGATVPVAAADEPHRHRRALVPVPTAEPDWRPVAEALGRLGTLSGGTVYRVGLARRDLAVTSYGVRIKAGLSLGSYAAFARYRDGKAMAMGDLVVTEAELQPVTDALHAHSIGQSALHNTCWPTTRRYGGRTSTPSAIRQTSPPESGPLSMPPRPRRRPRPPRRRRSTWTPPASTPRSARRARTTAGSTSSPSRATRRSPCTGGSPLPPWG